MRIICSVMLVILSLIILGMWGAILYFENPGTIAGLEPVIVDETPPTIFLNGAEEITIPINGVYEEFGAEAFDNRSEPEVEIVSNVDTTTVGEYFVDYYSVDEAGNEAVISRKVKVIEPKGIIYLTFDDGPGGHTARLLDILAKYNVKATFFVTGSGSDDLIKREYDEGHAVGLHTFSHNYSYIYSSVDNFFADLTAVQNRVESITGQKSFLMRFPGGSSNTISRRYDGKTRIMSKLVQEVENRGFTYFDWNITSGDAGDTTSTDAIYENVTKRFGASSIVLQHDTKGFSVDAVERIIQYGLDNGYLFMKLDANSPTAHHSVNN